MNVKRFDPNDQELIQRAFQTGQPRHIADAIIHAIKGLRRRLENMPNRIPIIDGRPQLMLHASAKRTFFDQYIIGLTLQEMADYTGQVITIHYVGDCTPSDTPACPDITFSE